MPETYVGRILRILQVAIRMLGISNREIERRLDWTPGYMTRILKGNIELKVDHLIDMANAMGLTPREMLLFAFPDRGEEPTEAAVRLEALMNELRPPLPPKPLPKPEPPKPADLTSADLERMIAVAVQNFFAKAAGTAGTPRPGS